MDRRTASFGLAAAFCGGGVAGLVGCAARPAPARDGTALSADGVPIRYRVEGAGETAVVLVHGWACDASYWRAQVPALAADHTVVALDLAGHGASGRGRSDWSIDRFGDDVAAVVRRLPNRRVVLVGHSMGGPAVVAGAARLADRPGLAGVIGVDTLKNVGLPPPPPPVRDGIVKSFQQDFAGTIRKNGERLFTKASDPQFVERIDAQMAAALPPDIAIAMLGGLFNTDWEANFARIRVPVVAINSDLGGPTDDARIRKTAPTFRSVTLEGTGHFMMLEAPQRFNAALLAQLAALPDA